MDVGLDPALGDDDALRQVLQLLVMGKGQLDEPRGDATPLVAPGQFKWYQVICMNGPE